MRTAGLEPASLTAADFKSAVYTNSTTTACYPLDSCAALEVQEALCFFQCASSTKAAHVHARRQEPQGNLIFTDARGHAIPASNHSSTKAQVPLIFRRKLKQAALYRMGKISRIAEYPSVVGELFYGEPGLVSRCRR